MGSRTQPLVDKISPYLSVCGQYASTPLRVTGQRLFCGRVLDPSPLLRYSYGTIVSVAEAVEGPHNHERLFVILSTHN